MEAIAVQALLFAMYLFWEIIPAVMVLVFFWYLFPSLLHPLQSFLFFILSVPLFIAFAFSSSFFRDLFLSRFPRLSSSLG